MIDALLAGNNRFRAREFTDDIDFYQEIAKEQRPEVLWIGCSDSRVSENIITDSKPGIIFVHRNVANLVSYNDLNVAAIIDYAINHLDIKDIVVCGHYGCGGIHALYHGIDDECSYIADWLLIASGARASAELKAREQNLSEAEHIRLLVEENVRFQLKHVRGMSLVRAHHRRGVTPRLHGWVYGLESGRLNIIEDGRV